MENSDKQNDKVSDFSKGLDLMTKSLYEAAKKASFRLGFGALSMGLTYLYMLNIEAPEQIKILIGLGVFFISAKIGGFLDELIDSKINKTNKEKNPSKNETPLIEAPVENSEVLDLDEAVIKEKIKEKTAHNQA